MKQKVFASVLIILAGIFFSILAAPLIMETNRHEASKDKLIANHIYDSISRTIATPITITQTMAADSYLLNALLNEGSMSKEEMEKQLSQYLSAINDRFGYLATFVVSEKTRRYYTPNGISKIVNPKKEPYDIWYKLFLNSGKDFALDTDRDQVNEYRWTVFVNARLNDPQGNLVGVCGVGLFMDDLQELIAELEKEYGVKINLIDRDGLVQVDTDSANIENAYISEAISDKAGSDSFVYTEKGLNRFRITRYMSNLEWFLVVQGVSLKSRSIERDFLISAVYAILTLLLLTTLFFRKKKQPHNLVKSSLPEDSLTGLPNRNYLKESYGELGIFNTTRYKSLCMFDVDRFKVVNETRGNGDEIILGIVEHAKETVGDDGILFRWSGDEFVVFLEIPVAEAEERFKKFCAAVKEALDVTVSVGIVTVDLSESIKTNYHRAVQMCYAVKENGGNGVKIKI